MRANYFFVPLALAGMVAARPARADPLISMSVFEVAARASPAGWITKGGTKAVGRETDSGRLDSMTASLWAGSHIGLESTFQSDDQAGNRGPTLASPITTPAVAPIDLTTKTTFETDPVPEPSALMLLGAVLLGIGIRTKAKSQLH